ncbi:nuclease harbi1-like protein [Plakobranchus ocellatus]|uniref:Nuclease harbi1-like protein n=1 Tax=Plakobranchus ocellatus TaxID=259542 RepID=A0AAV4CBB5_9GAST|nr:nuclease harbi1-like protein [Plakobranchus ocellatus]
MRTAISPHERLTATLRYLATGRSYQDLKFSACVSQPTLSKLIPETCSAIYEVLVNDYLKKLNGVGKLSFLKKWQFGVANGKHVAITPPPGSEDPCTHEITTGLRVESSNVADISPGQSRNASEEAKLVRDNITSYFNTVGKVAWQDKYSVS